MLNRLKQVTQENQDLETETAVLREAAEKLKYDLANYRLVSDINETDLTRMKAQMTKLDSKYLKAIQKINSFQLRMNNMQQEISYLRSICDEV
jgi:chromosome segregation ATPase